MTPQDGYRKSQEQFIADEIAGLKQRMAFGTHAMKASEFKALTARLAALERMASNLRMAKAGYWREQ